MTENTIDALINDLAEILHGTAELMSKITEIEAQLVALKTKHGDTRNIIAELIANSQNGANE